MQDLSQKFSAKVVGFSGGHKAEKSSHQRAHRTGNHHVRDDSMAENDWMDDWRKTLGIIGRYAGRPARRFCR